MNAILRKGFTAAILIAAETMSFGQGLDKYEIGLGAGIFVYQGDLTPSQLGAYNSKQPALQLFAQRKLTTAFSLRGGLAFGKLKGDDANYSKPSWRQQRNFNFSSPLAEITALLVWYPLHRKNKLDPYLFGGVGISMLNISRDYSNFNTEYFSNEPNVVEGLTIDAAHKLPKLLPVLPVGLGLRYSLNNSFSLITETSYRFTKTDYLDGFSRSANAAYGDHYLSHSVGLVYSFAKKAGLDCPTVVE